MEGFDDLGLKEWSKQCKKCKVGWIHIVLIYH